MAMETTKPGNRSLFLFTLATATLLCAASARAGDSRSDYAAGQKAPAFQAATVEGKKIKFPDDYKGKVVLLDFWATWCGPCRAELPNVAATYQKYHSKGFEILGVSLDQPNEGPKLIKFTHDNNMPWPQIYDGRFWDAAVPVKYGVHAIPCPILVDGDTGVILAEGPGALGDDLSSAVEKGLAAKSKK
jgi:thiol-disulfide isomerase/thioredoxin